MANKNKILRGKRQMDFLNYVLTNEMDKIIVTVIVFTFMFVIVNFDRNKFF